MESSQGTVCELAKSLETDFIKLGSDPSQKVNYNKPFPLVLQAVDPSINFIQLQEYFISKH